MLFQKVRELLEAGQPTTWGKFSPQWLNEVPSWSDDRGLRALEMLSYLAAAEEVTGDATYREAAESRSQSRAGGMLLCFRSSLQAMYSSTRSTRVRPPNSLTNSDGRKQSGSRLSD